MNKEKLRERCYEIGNSQLPIDVFYNDITQNTNPRFNKLLAYCDLEKIVNYIEDLRKENQELKNTILSLELDTCIPELKKENFKLKKIIKLLEDNLQLVLKQDIDPLLNRKVYAVGISKNYKLYSGFEVTQEQYELLKDVLGNKWYNKPLPAFVPEENYDYSFANGCFQKAEKYDCERLEKEIKRYSEEMLEDE